MSKDKKLIDLIYLEKNKVEPQLNADYQSRIKTYLNWVYKRQNDDQIIELLEEQTEFFMIDNLLRTFIRKRLDWVMTSIKDQELRSKYLTVLPPFSQKGDIKSFLLHFFQLKDQPQSGNLAFCFLNKSERELRILWDVYKLSKTLKSIKTLQQSVREDNSFPSCFSRGQIQETLSTLYDVLELIIRICIKQKYHSKILQQFPGDIFQPEAVLKRKEKDSYFVNDIVLEKFDYRNYLFYIYFRPSMKAIYKGEEMTFRFNYLDYEIIRQEFLIDWIHRKLKNNPKKEEVFNQYRVGDKTFNQLIAEDPLMEVALLKQLPKHLFEDLIAHVNESVDEEFQSDVDAVSDKKGEFAQVLQKFEKAKVLVQKSISFMRDYLKKMAQKSDSKKHSKGKILSAPLIKIPKFNITTLKKEEISFPYLCISNASFPRQLALLQAKMGPETFLPFDQKIGEFFSGINENSLIKRLNPRHEWVIPYLIEEKLEEETVVQLLILGAEVKNKRLGAGTNSSPGEVYDLKAYFVYGSGDKLPDMGSPQEKRTVKGKQFYIYQPLLLNVIKKVMELTDIIVLRNIY